jgi:hypothetical protein
MWDLIAGVETFGLAIANLFSKATEEPPGGGFGVVLLETRVARQHFPVRYKVRSTCKNTG